MWVDNLVDDFRQGTIKNANFTTLFSPKHPNPQPTNHTEDAKTFTATSLHTDQY
jgi:hypothetical protein